MSLDVLRQDALQTRKNDLAECQRAHRRANRALRSVTNLISNNTTLSTLLSANLDTENSPPPDSEESSWLKSCDLANGRYFDDTSISFPSLTRDTDSIYASKPNRPSIQPHESVHSNVEADLPATDVIATAPADPSPVDDPTTTVAAREATSTPLDTNSEVTIPATYSQRVSEQPDGPGVVPGNVAPPEPVEEASFSGATQRLLDLESPQKPAKVVRLPSEDAQEERLREEEEAERSRRSSVDHAKSSRTAATHLQSQAELASSPSSTVGAYSAATPMPPQDSPDTSPDSESAEQIEVLPPKDMRPSPGEQREKEEHDRLLEAQKDLARKAALGDVSDADEQLKWEEREAAARDAEERAARESMGGPEPNAKNAEDETQAEEVMEGVERDRDEEQLESSGLRETSRPATQPPTVDEDAELPPAQEDGDNITVASRNKAPLTIDTSTLQQPSQLNGQPTPVSAEQERMTTRMSSGVLQKRSVSEILGQTPALAGGSVLSPEGVSPMNVRHPQDTPAAAAGPSVLQTPRRHPQSPTPPRTPSNAQSLLRDLNVLKGAAEDPDRDYLEPLFRIQAHDSPNVRTTALPDLVRSASKTLSTEDHFTTLHERLDYRILRRIYQLQNANKWSLRQMDKVKEPEQPVTHQDHMMAEMKWMRKDFKAERKMKKSVCAWLAHRCADWVAASPPERKSMQVQTAPPKHMHKQTQVDEDEDEQPPELEHSGESAPEDDIVPPTPKAGASLPTTVIVPPDLSEMVREMQKSGNLSKALQGLPATGLSDFAAKIPPRAPLTAVSKFIESKVMPQAPGPLRKRSRYDYEDDAELLDREHLSKRLCEERELQPEDQDNALFHPENKPIRERLHANNAFRPPSEFVMPATQFYEFRNGSQWIWEDDQKLRKLAKEYSFNWSLIADELNLPGSFKSSAERRTPWECFERWVELDQLPSEMRKTMYFRTWFQRLEQSQQAAERRYQAHVATLQAQSNGQATHMPMRRRTVPSRVDKRKNTRYLWLVDAMRKLARKREHHTCKQAEAQRQAATRKTNNDNNQARPSQMLTPQEFSKKRHERDLQIAEAQRQHRQKMLEAQQRQLMAARAAQQQQALQQNGGAVPNQQQRPGSSGNMPAVGAQQAQMHQPNGQQGQPGMNGQLSQQGPRGSLPTVTRNGHLAVPQVNAQGIPQAQMRAPNGHMPNPQEMQRMAHANAQVRGGQYNGQGQGQQQQYQQMPNPGSMPSPGSGGLNAQQQMQSSQAMLAAAMQNQQQGGQAAYQNGTHQQMSASPSMPPPPTPQQSIPQALSSGHVPALLTIKNQLQAKYPQYNDQQINQMATEMLKTQSQSTNQARQSAMNAAAGINGGVAPQGNSPAYAHNQSAFQGNQQLPNGTSPTAYMNGDGSGQAQNMNPTSPQQAQYANLMRRQMQQQQIRMQQSPNGGLNGSPSMAHASPQMAPGSPSLQYSNMNQMAQMNMQGGMNAQQRPPSRSATPQMQRLGSSGSVPGMGGGMPSPQGVNGLQQGSPRNMQASLAR